MSQRFESLAALARLPWFELRDGALHLTDETVGPVIDAHAHLAMAYVLPLRVDLARETAEALTYLPPDRAFDLEGYLNRNFSEADLSRLKRDLTLGGLTRGGMRRTHTAPNLAREGRRLGIVATVVLPIEAPALSRNAEAYLERCGDRPDMIVFGSVHPYDPRAGGRLERQRAMGARGVKVHPAVQMVAPEDPRAMRLYRRCGARGMPVFFHCGPVDIETRRGRALSQVRRYRAAIEAHPETTFILGHSGALQMEEALGFAREFPNVYLELASQGLAEVRRIVDEGPEDRILFGTDWPFYSQAIGLAKALLATEDRPELRRKVLYENAAKLFGM